MEKISSILLPFDFSESAKKALDYAVDFVGIRPVKITLLHISDNKTIDDLKELYFEYQEKYNKQLKFPLKWMISWGDFIQTIIDAREEKHSEIIMIGTDGLNDDKPFTLSSELVAKAQCPVLVIPKEIKENTIKHIALVLGKEEIHNPKALYTLLDISRTFSTKISVVTVKNTDEITGYSAIDEKNENILNYYLNKYYDEHSYIENKDILEGIFDYSETHDIDMIAILPRHHVNQSIPSKGLLTRELVLKSHIPVLTLE